MVWRCQRCSRRIKWQGYTHKQPSARAMTRCSGASLQQQQHRHRCSKSGRTTNIEVTEKRREEQRRIVAKTAASETTAVGAAAATTVDPGDGRSLCSKHRSIRPRALTVRPLIIPISVGYKTKMTHLADINSHSLWTQLLPLSMMRSGVMRRCWHGFMYKGFGFLDAAVQGLICRVEETVVAVFRPRCSWFILGFMVYTLVVLCSQVYILASPV